MNEILSNYYFWLFLISLFCVLLEQIAPWRPQKFLRKQFLQDLFWMIFNLYLFFLIFSHLIIAFENSFLNFSNLERLKGMLNFSGWNIFLQFCIGLIVKDFIEWLIHNLLHRINFLWKIHQLHHSIKTMDWVGNIRFHFLEIIVYNTLKYLPLLFLNITIEAFLMINVFSTLIGFLNHSNIQLNFGLLHYIFNTPNMHIWHHDKVNHLKNGQNFGVIFSTWDYLFKTAYMPKGQPLEIGFDGEENYPEDIINRLLWPFKPQK